MIVGFWITDHSKIGAVRQTLDLNSYFGILRLNNKKNTCLTKYAKLCVENKRKNKKLFFLIIQ